MNQILAPWRHGVPLLLLAARAVKCRPLGLDDADDLALLAARTGLAGAAVDQERVRNLALLDVIDVGVRAVGTAALECLQGVANRFQQAARQAPELGARQRATRP